MRNLLGLSFLFALFSVSAQAASTQYLIRFKPSVLLSGGEGLLKDAGFRATRLFEEIGVFVVVVQDGVDEQKAVDALKRTRAVKYIERDQKHWHTLLVPTDPLYPQQYGPKQIGAEQAWNTTVGSRSVVVAVTDTGAQPDHPDLITQLVTGYSYINNSTNTTDQNGHGTHVSGIIGAAANNAVGIAGLNWLTAIMPVQFLDASGSGTDANGVSAILYAANHGARVINASWGGSGGSQALQDAVNYAYDHGALLIAAAGNSSSNNDLMPEFPAAYAGIAVAADDSTESLASFSNFGATTVGLAAPGVNILSTYIPSAWKELSGTSMATPMVTGVGALMLAVDGTLTALQLRDGLLNSAVAYPAYAGKTATGGEVNAAKAVQNLNGTFQVWPGVITLAQGTPFQFAAYRPNGAVTWSVSDASVATIAQDGTLTGNKGGTVTVTARDQSGASASAAQVAILASASPPGGGCFGVHRQGQSPIETAASAMNMGLPLLVAGIIGRVRRGRGGTS